MAGASRILTGRPGAGRRAAGLPAPGEAPLGDAEEPVGRLPEHGEGDDREEDPVDPPVVLRVDEAEAEAHRRGDELRRDEEQPALRQGEPQPGGLSPEAVAATDAAFAAIAYVTSALSLLSGVIAWFTLPRKLGT